MITYEYKVLATLSQGKFIAQMEKPSRDIAEHFSRWQVVHTENLMNEMGKEGWELVSVIMREEGTIGTVQEYYFKRALSEPPQKK